jgi:hypothetical protein
MSSRTLNFIDRLRSKSFDKAIITGNNLASYHYVENFDNITEEECVKIDIQNREIYKKNMDLYSNISKQIENKNAMFKIDTPPMAPNEPSNYDRFISHRIRCVSRNVKYQSYAINYLLNKGYKLIFEQPLTKIENEFEPFEAIDLCEKLENMSIDQIFKREYPGVKTSPNIYNNRKSMNLNITHSMPPGYYPVYPSDYPYYTYSTSNIPKTPNTPMSISAPSFMNAFHSSSAIPSAPPAIPSAPPAIPSAPSASSTPSSSSLSTLSSIPPKQIINAPPSSHYIHRDLIVYYIIY